MRKYLFRLDLSFYSLYLCTQIIPKYNIMPLKNAKITPYFQINEFFASRTADESRITNMPESISSVQRLCSCLPYLSIFLTTIRNCYGDKICISSGYRNSQLNAKVGGVQQSRHLNGEAADLVADDNKRLLDVATSVLDKIKVNYNIIPYKLINEKPTKSGYPSWIHLQLTDLVYNLTLVDWVRILDQLNLIP